MSHGEVLLQQIIIGLSNGMIIALIALGYTMVYGIIELINFAHGDLFMLGGFFALTLLGMFGLQSATPDAAGTYLAIAMLFLVVPIFCGALNWSVDKFAYRHLRKSSRLAPLVSAIGVSFVFMNIGLFWGGAPMEVFGGGKSAAAPKDFPALVSSKNIFAKPNLGLDVQGNTVVAVHSMAEGYGIEAGDQIVKLNDVAVNAGNCLAAIAALETGKDASVAVKKADGTEATATLFVDDARNIQVTRKELLVWLVTVPLMVALTWFVKRTRTGKAMRAVAQNQVAAQLMGINVNGVIGRTFMLGGALGGVASVVFALYNNTINFQMGFRAGLDAFTAAVLGGIGNLPGAVLGGVVIGLVRAFSDQYVGTRWTSAVVFSILVLMLVFRPSGLLGTPQKDKV
jgi:branched-chain amino acid transport system permease protein